MAEYREEGNTVVITGSATTAFMMELVSGLSLHAYQEMVDDETPPGQVVAQAELSTVCLFMQFAVEKPEVSKRLLTQLGQWPATDVKAIDQIAGRVEKVLDMDEEADANGLG